MPAQEIDVTITPEQAARGVILTVTLAHGPARVRIPSNTEDGEAVHLRVGDTEVVAHVRISATPQPITDRPPTQRPPTPAPAPTPTAAAHPRPPTPQPPGHGNPFATRPIPTRTPGPTPPPPPPTTGGSKGVGCLIGVGICVAALVAFLTLGTGDDSDDKASASTTTTPSAPYLPPTYDAPTPAPTPPSSATPETTEPQTSEPQTTEAQPPTPSATPETPAVRPFTRDTCLSGELPNSTTAQRVDDDVKEVSCSSSEAHYRVIGSIPMTSDMDRCDEYPRTEYGFSSRYTMGGTVINEYVYCLVGIGSYSRS
ncbi:LppU/SCO3897 family protein [Streptomyces sp. BI20]|uniref:LppU/SCO3897 family protein n=1 Tax=Streptomyces sp. BI20 TaxID=3403460 RepID=UPI003C77B199